jgi:acetyl-CoA carboxylase biotin carboxyl carrier protein
MTESFILTVIDKFSAASIGELVLEEGGARLSLRRDGGRSGEAAPSALSGQESSGPEKTAKSALEEILSPLVAVFYAAPGPDSPPFVEAGSRVKVGESLCVLEAMKMMNRLEAEFPCEIVEVLASGGEMVEYGQPLFRVRRI